MGRPLPTARLALSALSAAAFAFPALADNPDDARRASLETTPAPLGSTFSGAVRSTVIGAPAFLGVSAGDGPLVLPGLPVVHLDPATLFFLAAGVVDGTGRLTFATGVPNDPAIAGVPVYFQGFVVVLPATVHASNAVSVRPGASATASFSNLSGSLPAVTALANTDADFADLDGDGDLDLVLATATGPAVLANSGTGSFLDATSSLLPPSALGEVASCVEAFDADGDGDLDLFVGGGLAPSTSPAVPNRLLLNVGGAFALSASFPAGGGLTTAAAAGDLDGDGDPDLVLSNGPDSTHAGLPTDSDTLLVNDGAGGFTPDPAFSSATWNDPSTATQHVAAGDIDNDGDLDLFFSTSGPTPGVENRLVRNDGGLSFTNVTATQLLPSPLTKSFEAAFLDVDGDGFLDLLVAGSGSSSPAPALYSNQGPGTPGVFTENVLDFPQASAFPPFQSVRIGMALGDVDADGDVDVVHSVHHLPSGPPPATSGESILFLNQGGAQGGTLGVFAVDPAFDPFGDFVADDAALGDADGDADPDLYIVNFGHFGGLGTADRYLRNDLP
jgi:hypothetical protein